MRIELLVVGFVEDLGLDSHVVEQTFGDCAVRRGTFNRLRPAVAQQQPFADAEFVAPRVSAEIVMIFENENAGIGAGLLAEEVCGG